jgi:hypothetical protein
MDLEGLEAEALNAGKLAFADVVGALQNEYDALPPSLREAVKEAAEGEARARVMQLAGVDPSGMVTAAKRGHWKATLANVKVGGRIALYQVIVHTVDNVLMSLLTLAGTALRKVLGLP